MVVESVTVLALDPSLRNTGYVIATVTKDTVTYTSCGVITTEPKKQNIGSLIADATHLYTEVSSLLSQADIVCSEASFFAKDAKAAVVKGVIVGLLTIVKNNAPLHVVTQSQAKKATGQDFKDKDPKAVVMEWALAHLPESLVPMYRGKVNQTKFNHIADAVAVLHASLPTLRNHLCKSY